jgi:hypothetical protein
MPSRQQWLKQWDVPASSGGTWKVSLKRDGTYACSCPAWKFAKGPKPDCRHIQLVKESPSGTEVSYKERVLANVEEVRPRGNNELLTPLIPMGDLHFALTVACDLAHFGARAEDVAQYLYGNSLRKAREYIAQKGRKIYGPWSDRLRRHDGFRIVWGPPFTDRSA